MTKTEDTTKKDMEHFIGVFMHGIGDTMEANKPSSMDWTEYDLSFKFKAKRIDDDRIQIEDFRRHNEAPAE